MDRATYVPESDSYKIKPDIIKIDVEGFEVEVLNGGLNTLNESKNIIIETHSKILQVEVAKILMGLGFHLKNTVRNYTAKDVRVEYWER